MDATPAIPAAVKSSSSSGVKPATPEIMILSDVEVPIEVMTDLIFEDIGGQEIINISRHDIINGQDVIYQPIRNLTSIAISNNSQNIIPTQDTSDSYFKNFSIKLENKIPEQGSGPNGEYVYIDQNTGNIIINVINLTADEQVEIQILNTGTILNDTIY